MGKALLIIVLGGSAVLARQLYNTTETESRTNAAQTSYQEEVIAREIAASAFNVAMGEIRSFGEDVKTGAETFNGATGKRTGTYASGRFAGGSYETHAELTSGHSVRVVSVGQYGDASFTMHDEYRVPVLIAREDGLVVIEPGDSSPDVCSAMFYQAYPIGATAPTDPVMIYTSSFANRNGKQAVRSVYATAGTQMNFFIAVDENCDMVVDTSTGDCAEEEEAASHTFDASQWDAIYFALDIDAADVDQAEEGDWAYVEQNADDRQNWRISWEDRSDWASVSGEPYEALTTLKGFGYDGTGWSLSGSGFVGLLNLGDTAPDFSDQRVSVTVYAANDSGYKGKQKSMLARQKHCGQTMDQPLDGDEYDVDNDGTVDIVPAPEPEPSTDPEPEAEVVESDISEDDMIDYACACTSNGTLTNKTAILHRPPGNEANEQLICIGTPAVGDHFANHNDVFPSCESGSAVRNNKNKNK